MSDTEPDVMAPDLPPDESPDVENGPGFRSEVVKVGARFLDGDLEPGKPGSRPGANRALVAGWMGYCQCGFVTDGWPERAHAVDRVHQHKNEHATGDEMESLEAFRATRGILVNGDGRTVMVVRPEDEV